MTKEEFSIQLKAVRDAAADARQAAIGSRMSGHTNLGRAGALWLRAQAHRDRWKALQVDAGWALWPRASDPLHGA